MPNICPFCNLNPAKKKNSHIISNFLTTTLKASPLGNKVFTIEKYLASGKYPSTQDSSKESNIFCDACEFLFNFRYERHIANTFYKSYQQKNNHFDVYLHSSKLMYRVYTNTDYIIFKKFLLLQLYRAHVTSLPEYKSILLSDSQLKIVYDSLFNESVFRDIKITVLSSTDKAPNVISAMKIDTNSYFIWMNEFICIFEFDVNCSLLPKTDGATNYLNNSPRVIFLSLATWNKYIDTLIQLVGKQ
jgi:hypothetical protein